MEEVKSDKNLKEGDAVKEKNLTELSGGENSPKEAEDKKEPAKEEKKVPPFVTYGGEVAIKEEDNIAYYKTRYTFLSATFKLLGRFDKSGRYLIGDDIKRELLAMPKEIAHSTLESYKAVNTFYGKEFNFYIEITKQQEGRAKASLFIEENVDRTLACESLKTRVADYIDSDDEEFRIKVRKVFNLLEFAPPVDEFNFPNIAVLMQNYLDLDIVVGELFDVASQIFLLRILKLLEETPQGREIIARYKALLRGDEDKYERKFTYLRMLLERVIDDYGGFEKLPIKQEDKKKLTDDLNLPLKNLKKQTQSAGAPKIEEGEKGAEGGSKSSDKAPSKSSAKAPAKKPAKKPTKKAAAKKGGKKPAKKKGGKNDKKEKKVDLQLVFYSGGGDDGKSSTSDDAPSGDKTIQKDTTIPQKTVIEKPSDKPLDVVIDVQMWNKMQTLENDGVMVEKPKKAGGGGDINMWDDANIFDKDSVGLEKIPHAKQEENLNDIFDINITKTLKTNEITLANPPEQRGFDSYFDDFDIERE